MPPEILEAAQEYAAMPIVETDRPVTAPPQDRSDIASITAIELALTSLVSRMEAELVETATITKESAAELRTLRTDFEEFLRTRRHDPST